MPAHSTALSACCVRLVHCRLIIVSNVLPIRGKKEAHGWEFEWDQDALVAQAKVSRGGGRISSSQHCQRHHLSGSCHGRAASKLALLPARIASGPTHISSCSTDLMPQQLLMVRNCCFTAGCSPACLCLCLRAGGHS